MDQTYTDLSSFVHSRRLIGTLDLFPEILDRALEEIDAKDCDISNAEDDAREQKHEAGAYKTALETALSTLKEIKYTDTKAVIMAGIEDAINEIEHAL